MIERREELRLAREAGEALRVGREQLRQNLERAVAMQLRVAPAETSPIPPTPISAVISYAPSRVPAASAMVLKADEANCRLPAPHLRCEIPEQLALALVWLRADRVGPMLRSNRRRRAALSLIRGERPRKARHSRDRAA